MMQDNIPEETNYSPMSIHSYVEIQNLLKSYLQSKLRGYEESYEIHPTQPNLEMHAVRYEVCSKNNGFKYTFQMEEHSKDISLVYKNGWISEKGWSVCYNNEDMFETLLKADFSTMAMCSYFSSVEEFKSFITTDK